MSSSINKTKTGTKKKDGKQADDGNVESVDEIDDSSSFSSKLTIPSVISRSVSAKSVPNPTTCLKNSGV